MSLIIKGMSLPKHVAVNGEKDITYKCVIVVTKDYKKAVYWVAAAVLNACVTF